MALRRKGLRGAGPMEAVLGIVLFGLLLSGFVEWLDRRQRSAWEREAGREMAILAEAAEDYVRAEYGTLLSGAGTPASPAPREIAVATLRTAGVLPGNFDGVDAMNRDLRILVMPRGAGAAADGLRVVTAQAVEGGDLRYPGSAVFEARGFQAMGVVEPVDAAPDPHDLRIRGPAVDADVTDFQGADFDGDGTADGLPDGYALAVLMEFDEEDVCGDQLYRRATICTNGSRMETALDMGGNEIRNAASIGAQSMTLSGDLSSASLDVTGAVTVGQGIEVTGAAAFGSTLETTGSANVTGSVRAASATVTGAATAGSATVTGQINATSAVFGSVTVGSCSGC